MAEGEDLPGGLVHMGHRSARHQHHVAPDERGAYRAPGTQLRNGRLL